MRAERSAGLYLVGTPKGRLSKLEAELLDRPWQQVREGSSQTAAAGRRIVRVRAEPRPRSTRSARMRRRQLKWLWKRLKELRAMKL